MIQLAITSISHRGSQILCSGLALRSNLLLNPLRNTNTFREPLQLPKGKKCKVFDITGRVVDPAKMTQGVYFIEVDDVVTQKVVKVR
ncbi:hypothetical protein AMJ83_07450 [candidate division WOR_3 bacterium SM23_42]|uniref:Uncharacterized protein n=1 Tax=candidate division WOR_3 bacterium SM23_42 TaxID=1703779 RepID=A0A0S8FT43_UNCW3|nr:MAG: hypothetical protein AMJ83_07450 [candidate division WOR_3 bacterium SM23_42]